MNKIKSFILYLITMVSFVFSAATYPALSKENNWESIIPVTLILVMQLIVTAALTKYLKTMDENNLYRPHVYFIANSNLVVSIYSFVSILSFVVAKLDLGNNAISLLILSIITLLLVLVSISIMISVVSMFRLLLGKPPFFTGLIALIDMSGRPDFLKSSILLANSAIIPYIIILTNLGTQGTVAGSEFIYLISATAFMSIVILLLMWFKAGVSPIYWLPLFLIVIAGLSLALLSSTYGASAYAGIGSFYFLFAWFFYIYIVSMYTQDKNPYNYIVKAFRKRGPKHG